MAKLNKSKILKAVNESIAAQGSSVRVRFNSEYKEFQVCYSLADGSRTFAPADSLIDAIETAIMQSSWTLFHPAAPVARNLVQVGPCAFLRIN
jgi:hypothetical protein